MTESNTEAAPSADQLSWQTLARGPWYVILVGLGVVLGLGVSIPIVSFRYGAIGSGSLVDKLIPSLTFGLFAGLSWVVMVTPRVQVRGLTVKVVNPFFVWEVPAPEITGFRTTVGLQISVATGRNIPVAACPQSPWAGMTGNRYAEGVANRLDKWRIATGAPSVTRSADSDFEATWTAQRTARWTAFVSVMAVCASVVVLSLIALLMAT